LNDNAPVAEDDDVGADDGVHVAGQPQFPVGDPSGGEEIQVVTRYDAAPGLGTEAS
jgi:hypothetical protein